MDHHRIRPHLLRAAPSDPSVARTLRRRHASGHLVRIRSGVYIDSREWEALGEVGQHLARARAVAPTLPDGVAFSHLTAALIHGWPLIGPAPDRVHVVDPGTPGVVHRSGLVRHHADDLDVGEVHFDGVAVTVPLRAAVQVATTTVPQVAAVAIDHAVRSGVIEVPALVAALPDPPARGSRRSRLVASALHPAHESAGESYAAIRMAEVGLPNAIPQQEFRLPDGSLVRVDFWIPELGVVIEFDGKQKYVDPSMLHGQDPTEVLWREKRREDQLRIFPEVRAVIRVIWWDLVELDRFRAALRLHGLRV